METQTITTADVATTTPEQLKELVVSVQKPRKATVQVDSTTFQLFLFECRQENMTQSQMSRAYAKKFGGAEGSAIQKYTGTLKTYKDALAVLEEKEKTEGLTENDKTARARLTKVLGEITLRLGKGEGGRKKGQLTSPDTLEDLLKKFGELSTPEVATPPKKEEVDASFVGQIPRQQPIMVDGGDIHIQTGDLDVTIHHKQQPVRELQSV